MLDVTSPAHIRKTVEDAVEIFVNGDWGRLETVAHPGGRLHIMDGIHIKGFDKLAAYMDYYRDYYDIQVSALSVTVDDAHAAAEMMTKVAYVKDKPGFPPATGQTGELPIATFYKFKDGRIQSSRMLFSAGDWLRIFAEPPVVPEAV